jgi:glycosyltransferase involved in cell wall biosynthesis
MSSHPLVSVIVPTYNRRDLLVRALKSINAQTWPALEVLVVNDCGPEVEDAVRPLLVRPVDRYFRHPVNRGLSAGRNTALAAATGEYIAYLDDDDLWYPNHVETLVSALREKGASIAYSNAVRVSYALVDGQYVETGRLVVSEPWDRTRMVLANYLHPLSFLHTRACLDEVGGFDELLTRSEDMDLWIRISARHAVLHVPVATCEYRMVNDGSTMTSGSEEPFLRARTRIFSKYPDEVTRAVDEMINRWKRTEREVERLRQALEKLRSNPITRLLNRLGSKPDAR